MECLKEYVTLGRIAILQNTNCGFIDYKEKDLRKLYKIHGLSKREIDYCIRTLEKEGSMHIEYGLFMLGRNKWKYIFVCFYHLCFGFLGTINQAMI